MARTKQVTIIQTPGEVPGTWLDLQKDGKAVAFDGTADAIKAIKTNQIAKFRIVRVVKAGTATVSTVPRVKIEF